MNLVKRYDLDYFYGVLTITFHETFSEKSYELTDFEKQIIEHIPENFRYMARDEDGDLCIYEEKPRRDYFGDGTWTPDGMVCECIPLKNVFEFIKWENKEPWDFRYEVNN